MADVDFDWDVASVPLAVKDGVAAFDAVTLHMAARMFNTELVGDEQSPIRLARQLAGDLPAGFSSMADVSVNKSAERKSVRVVIDTGKLEWDTVDAPEASAMTSYAGRTIQSIEFDDTPVVMDGKTPIVRLPLKLPGGITVDGWFAELQQPLTHVDGLWLHQQATAWMQSWNALQGSALRADSVQVPKLQSTCESLISDAATAHPAPRIQQEFRTMLDETGVRVIAVT
ncbi:hypothetical protein ACRQDV_06995 [Actinotignum sp. GS-2025e]|uniref:hypothetical protein n=1 Tax=Actinotignum sp. GS-2025e TaxID=3427278 RepID=UPI003F480636